jgi:hypothetical protein
MVMEHLRAVLEAMLEGLSDENRTLEDSGSDRKAIECIETGQYHN